MRRLGRDTYASLAAANIASADGRDHSEAHRNELRFRRGSSAVTTLAEVFVRPRSYKFADQPGGRGGGRSVESSFLCTGLLIALPLEANGRESLPPVFAVGVLPANRPGPMCPMSLERGRREAKHRHAFSVPTGMVTLHDCPWQLGKGLLPVASSAGAGSEERRGQANNSGRRPPRRSRPIRGRWLGQASAMAGARAEGSRNRRAARPRNLALDQHNDVGSAAEGWAPG